MSEDKKKDKPEKVTEGIVDKIQKQLDEAHNKKEKPDNKIVDKVKDAVLAKVATIADFTEYYRPYQERRTLMWNELGQKNSYDIPINANAGKPLEPADFSRTITLYYNDPSREQMNNIEKIRGMSQDLDRQERAANAIPLDQLEKKYGIKLPKNYFSISTEAAEKKEELLTARIIMFCGVDEHTAGNIATIAHAGSLDDILDSWEYRARTGFPNSSPVKDGTPNTSSSAFQ
jgi:hypothetical protein